MFAVLLYQRSPALGDEGVPLCITYSAAYLLTSAIEPPTLFTLAIEPATVFTFATFVATVFTFVMLPAVVFTFAILAATVLTELLPDPVFTALVINPKSSVNVNCPATILMVVKADWLGVIGLNQSPELPS